MAYLALTRRALRDIQEIKDYSCEQWGNQVADEYLSSIEDALNLLRQNPALLREKPNVSNSLCFYRVRQHFLVCTIIHEKVLVLTVKHGAMDLPERIYELEPLLIQEAEFLHQAITTKR
ncbi:MAG: type II toxin-antitoxin system RelE/ParE family toxin [Verrucomicrobiota bacterium]